MSATGRARSLENLTPAEPGNVLALKHGARSERQVSALATSQKRAFLRRNGLRLSDLEGIGVALLDAYARAQSKVVLMDAHFDRVGFLDGAGEPIPATKIYFTALNAATRTLRQLNDHLRVQQQRDPLAAYMAFLEAPPGAQDDDDEDEDDEARS